MLNMMLLDNEGLKEIAGSERKGGQVSTSLDKILKIILQ